MRKIIGKDRRFIIAIIISLVVIAGIIGLCLIIAQNKNTNKVTLPNGTVLTIFENYLVEGQSIIKSGTLTVTHIELAEDGEVIIPPYVNGMPITQINPINGCSLEDTQALRKIVLPDTLLQINSFFPLCTSLETIDIGKATATIDYSIFENCINLKAINVAQDNSRYYCENGCLIERESNTVVMGLSNVNIPETVDCIGDFAFSGTVWKSDIIIPEGVTSIGTGAFYNCTATGFHLPNSIETIGIGAFCNSDMFTSIELPSQLQQIPEELFVGCDSLEQILIGAKVDAIAEDAFFGCSSLSVIKVDPFNQKYYSDQNCLIEKESNRLIVSAKYATLSETIKIIGRGALSETTTLGTQAAIVIPPGVSKIETLAICGYDGVLTYVYIPNSVVQIEEYAITLTGDQKDLTVYCEAEEKPIGWNNNWLGNITNTRVIWGADLLQLEEIAVK